MSREQIAQVLKECRMKKGLKATTVGEMIHKSGKTVSGWEHGIGQPDIDTLMKLCVIYEIDNFDVFRDEDESTGIAINPDSLNVAHAYQKAAPAVKEAVKRFLGISSNTLLEKSLEQSGDGEGSILNR